MAFEVGGGGGSMSEINVTPLVDVMLVLLVIFMVTATLLKPKEPTVGENLSIPVTRDNPNVVDLANSNQIILWIDANLRVYLRQPPLLPGQEWQETLITDCSTAALTPTVEAFLPCLAEIGLKLGLNPRLAAEHALYVLADTRIPYGFVAGTLAQLRHAGVDEVGMITNPDYVDPAAGN